MTRPANPVMHMLKCVDPYYDEVARGDKVHELRQNDRDFRKGDVLWIRRYHPVSQQYGEGVFRLVTYIMVGPYPVPTAALAVSNPGLPSDWCIMSMRPTEYFPDLWPIQDRMDWNQHMRNMR